MMKNNPLKTLFFAFFLFLGLAGSDRADQTVRSDRFSLPELKSLVRKPAFYLQTFDLQEEYWHISLDDIHRSALSLNPHVS